MIVAEPPMCVERNQSFPLSERRAILGSVIEPGEHVALSQVSDRSAAEMLKFVMSHGLEGVVAKRSDSVYQPGQRTGLGSKYRVNLGQEFMIGGYVPSHLGVDCLQAGHLCRWANIWVLKASMFAFSSSTFVRTSAPKCH
jgi:hypothetical protein